MATVYVQQSGGDYSTLAGAMSSRTAGGDTIAIQGSWTVDDTSICTNSYPTTVTTDSSSKCGVGAASSPSHYRLRPTSGNAITLSADLTMTGVEVGSASTTASDEIFRLNANSVTLSCTDCNLYFQSRNSEQDIFYTNTNDDWTVTFTNCAFWNVYRGVIDDFNASGTNTVNFNSCSGYNIGYSATVGVRSGVYGSNSSAGKTNSVNFFNSHFHINTGYVFNAGTNGTHNNTAHTCLTNVATWQTGADSDTQTAVGTSYTYTDGTPGVGSIIAVNDITTTDFLDLSLQDDANNDAQDNHATTSGAGLSMPSTDSAGTSRPQNTNYDIGFFEVVAAGGGATGKSNPLRGPMGGPMCGPMG